MTVETDAHLEAFPVPAEPYAGPGVVVNLAVAGTTTILDVSDSGMLSAIGFSVRAAISGVSRNRLRIAVDDLAFRDLTHIYGTASTSTQDWTEALLAFATTYTAPSTPGRTINDSAMLPMAIHFRTRLQIAVAKDVTGTGSIQVVPSYRLYL